MTHQTLSEQHRPTTFKDFKGSPLVVSMLTKMVEKESLPSCLMFTGKRGVGKTSAARILNHMMNEGLEDTMSFLEVDAASYSGIDNVRSIQEIIRFSHAGNWRFVVLDEAHGLSSAAFNALLKVLETPPPRTTFILCTTRPESIPDTVQSRSMVFRFQDLDVASIARRVAEVIIEDSLPIKDPKVVARIAEVSDGSLRTALIYLQQILLVDTPTVEAVNQLSGYVVSTKDLMYAMLSGDLAQVEEELSVVFGSSCDIDRLLLSLIRTVTEFHDSGLINNAHYLSCMSIVWNMRKLQRSNDTVARTQLEAGMFAMFSQNFWNGKEKEDGASISSPASTEAVLSL